MSAPTVSLPWPSFWRHLNELSRKISSHRATEVRSAAIQAEAGDLVQSFFRETRPYLVRLGITEQELEAIDNPLQELLRLSYARNPTRAYRDQLRALESQRAGLEVRVATREGSPPPKPGPRLLLTRKESQILRTLADLVPTAAQSYEQAIIDLADESRKSFRGTASELREALREVVDRLAPDREVVAQPDFKFERDQTRPVLKQKVRFVLASRGSNDAVLRSTRDTSNLVELTMGSLARSVYDRGSVMAHVTATRHDVRMLKEYVDLLLGELLQIAE